jgi:ribonuclease HI
MNNPRPHYMLVAETRRNEGAGSWRFALRPADGSAGVEVADVEPDVWGERLELLTVVRALESLDQPSRVTLVGCTRYVEQGILYGLVEWQENDWRWEYFGQMTPVRDADLWQRMDRALDFHRVECGRRRFDAGHSFLAVAYWNKARASRSWVDRVARGDWLKHHAPALVAWCGVWMEAIVRFGQKVAGLRTRGWFSGRGAFHAPYGSVP